MHALLRERAMGSNEINYARLPKRRIGTYEYPSYGDFLKILVKKFSKAGYLVLDAGCGDGRFLKNLREGTYGVELDIERENIKEAKKRKGLKNRFFVIGDLQYLPFKIETFNFIFCRDVLEHVKSGEKAIDELTFVLKKKAVILISTTNLLNPALLLDTLLPNKVSTKVIKKFGGYEYYERTFRFFPWKIIKKLRENELDVKVVMFGYPPIGKPGIYHLYNVKPPMMYYLWIALDRITNFNLLRKFKEVIVAIARK